VEIFHLLNVRSTNLIRVKIFIFMKWLNRLGCWIFYIGSGSVLLYLLIYGGSSLLAGISIYDLGFTIVSAIILVSSLLGGVIFLQLAMPQLTIVTSTRVETVFWLVLGIPGFLLSIMTGFYILYAIVLMKGDLKPLALMFSCFFLPLYSLDIWVRRKTGRSMYRLLKSYFLRQ
jgi:hypothetical protein